MVRLEIIMIMNNLFFITTKYKKIEKSSLLLGHNIVEWLYKLINQRGKYDNDNFKNG